MFPYDISLTNQGSDISIGFLLLREPRFTGYLPPKNGNKAARKRRSKSILAMSSSVLFLYAVFLTFYVYSVLVTIVMHLYKIVLTKGNYAVCVYEEQRKQTFDKSLGC